MYVCGMQLAGMACLCLLTCRSQPVDDAQRLHQCHMLNPRCAHTAESAQAASGAGLAAAQAAQAANAAGTAATAAGLALVAGAPAQHA